MKKILFILLVVVSISCKKDKDDTAPAPEANFTIASHDGIAPEGIVFTNQSKNAEDFVWFFGDGQASMEYSPTHQYKKGGEYTVLLKVFGPGGKDSIQTKITLEQPSTLYQVKNKLPVALENVRTFYLDWEEMLVYDIIDHGSMEADGLTEQIPTSNPSVEVLFLVEGTYYQMAYPDPIVKDQLNTITISDTSHFYTFDKDPISSTSMVRENSRRLIRIEELIK